LRSKPYSPNFEAKDIVMNKIVMFTLTVVLFATACKHKDEKYNAIKAEMSAFEKDWAATADMMNNWGLELETALKTINTDSTKNLRDSSMAACNNLVLEYDKKQQEWKLTEKTYTDWKKMFEDGIVKTPDALRSLREFKDKLEKYNTLLDEWKGKLEGCKSEHAKARAEVGTDMNGIVFYDDFSASNII
jgi:chromosome segregation ATPase